MSSPFFSRSVPETHPQWHEGHPDKNSLNTDAHYEFFFNPQVMLSPLKKSSRANSDEMDTPERSLLMEFKNEKVTIFSESNSTLPSTMHSSLQISQMLSSRASKNSHSLERFDHQDIDTFSDFRAFDDFEDFEDDRVSFDETNQDVAPKNKKSQNPMKNHQGTIAGKIKKQCQRKKATGRNTRLFDKGTETLTEGQKEEFREWVSKYNKEAKTWAKIRNFLENNLVFADIFVEMVILFLSEEFKTEYEESLTQGQMSQKTQDLLKAKESKDFYMWKFSLVMDELKGEVSNFENEMKKPRKALRLI